MMKKRTFWSGVIAMTFCTVLTVSATTTYTVTTFAGTPNVAGFADGTGLTATFRYPNSLSRKADGSIWIADRGNNAIRSMTAEGVVTTISTPNGSFNAPWQGNFDSQGNYFVADKANHRIQKVTPDGTVTTFATGFSNPMSLIFDNEDNMYVSDRDNKAIKKITPAGVISTYASLGTFLPNCAVFDKNGNLLVGSGNTYTIVSVAPDGTVTTVAGDGTKGTASLDGTPGQPLTAEIGQYFGFDIDSNGVLYMADYLFHTIRTLTPDENGDYSKGTVKTIAGTGQKGFADGNGSTATFTNPLAILVNPDNSSFFVTESSNIIRKITIDTETGINEINNQTISIYPNPASEYITVNREGISQIEIFSITGASILRSTSDRISLENIPAGIYVVKVNNHATERLIVRK